MTEQKIRVRLDPEDDFLHPLEAAENFNESMYFNVFDRQRKLGGWFRMANRPNEGRGEMTCCIYLPDGRIGFMFARPQRRDNDALDGGGMKFDVIEPDAGQSFARGHTEQHTRGSGTIKIGTENFTIDGLGLRDHSWGPRYWQAIYWYRWLPMSFSEDFAMMVSITCRPGEEPRAGGMVLRDGEYVMIRQAKIATKYDDNQCQETFEVWAETDERQYQVSGRVMSLIPLRNRRRTPEGEDLLTRITEGMTEYRCDGLVGYGLSEYLDQVVDDVPVGMKAGH